MTLDLSVVLLLSHSRLCCLFIVEYISLRMYILKYYIIGGEYNGLISSSYYR